MTELSRGAELHQQEDLILRRESDLEWRTRTEIRVEILEDEVDVVKKTQAELLNYQRESAANLKTLKYSVIFGIVGYTVSTLCPKGLELLAKVALLFV